MSFYHKYILPKLLDFTMKRKEIEKLRPDVVSGAFGTVLEIGFGSGLNLPYYKNVTKLYALEPSFELYNLTSQKIKTVSFPVEYVEASAEKIPLPDNSIDSVISTWTMCTIPHPEKALKEIRRVLKPGGKFIFIEHGKSPRWFIAKIQTFFTPVSKCVAGGCHLNREIDVLILQAGFEFEKIEKFEQKSKLLAFMYKGVAIDRQVL